MQPVELAAYLERIPGGPGGIEALLGSNGS